MVFLVSCVWVALCCWFGFRVAEVLACGLIVSVMRGVCKFVIVALVFGC